MLNYHPKFYPFVMETKSDISDSEELRELLKRCLAGTFEAALADLKRMFLKLKK